MRYVPTAILAACISLGATVAYARDCSPIGKVWVENGIRYKCVPKTTSNSRAYQQADSERRSNASGCQYDGRGNCVRGGDLPSVNLSGRQPTTRDAVFPGLSKSDWSRLQKSPQGRDLIKQADALRVQQSQADKAINEIRHSPNAAQRQTELISAIQKRDQVGGQLNKMQGQAKVILDQ